MLDLNFFKWNWSQRFILISYIIAFHYTIRKPYASLKDEFSEKYFSSAKNILCWATVICLLIACTYCFGMYRLKFKNFMYGAFGCIGFNVLFLLAGFAKDRRLPTLAFFISIVFVLVTCGLVWYDSSNYRYYDK